MNYINGFSTPRFIIEDNGGNHIETIDLDLTMEEGLVESLENRTLTRQLLNGGFVTLPRKDILRFTLDYSSFTGKANALAIARLYDYFKAADSLTGRPAHRIWLIPRSDVLARQFEVEWEGESLDIGILKGGSQAAGHRLISLQFVTKNPVNILWIDPDNVYSPVPVRASA